MHFNLFVLYLPYILIVKFIGLGRRRLQLYLFLKIYMHITCLPLLRYQFYKTNSIQATFGSNRISRFQIIGNRIESMTSLSKFLCQLHKLNPVVLSLSYLLKKFTMNMCVFFYFYFFERCQFVSAWSPLLRL